MRHLNYSHLLYFWTVAREGSIAKAAETLYLTPQTISGQLKLLEESVGEPLFQRVGRGLALTDTGHVVNQYADEIFSLGAELAHRLRSKEPGMPGALNVGITNSIPKLIAYRILEPVLKLEEPLRMVCYEGDLDKLLGDLAVHRLDMVLSDRPVPPGLNLKAFNHTLGTTDVAFFAQRRKATRLARSFPDCLDGEPLLLPLNDTPLRRSIDDWLETRDLNPRVVGEFDDSALLKAFGEAGVGIFPAPVVMASEIERMYHARSIGTLDNVTETFYAISPERKLKHPAVLQITDKARQDFLP